MDKEEIDEVAHILTNIKSLLVELNDAYKKKDGMRLNETKRKILAIQMKIEGLK